MKPKIKKPKPLHHCGPDAWIENNSIRIEGWFCNIENAIALRKWLGEAIKYLKQESKTKHIRSKK